MKTGLIVIAVSCCFYSGCATEARKPEVVVPVAGKVVKPTSEVKVVVKGNHRQLTTKQEELLRTFSLKEAPQLWKTIQSLRGEIVNREKSKAQLAADLREFDRKPEEDATYRELELGQEQITCTLDKVYQKLENAYIAYKKFQATPGKKEYADAMNRALEDGVHEAEATARRYQVMALDK